MNWTIHLIPKDPFFCPGVEAVQSALNVLDAYFVRHEGISHDLSNKLSFWCAGENFERVECNHCQSNIIDWFISHVQSWEIKSTNDLLVILPCCGVEGSLLELSFEDVSGFARFALTIREGYNDEHETNELNDKVLHELELILRCPLRVVWSGH